MSRNYYEFLGLRQSASDASIRRAIDATKVQINEDAKLSPNAKGTRLAELQTAADALCSPAKRDEYDAALHKQSDASASGLFSPRTLIIALTIAVFCGVIYWQYDRNQTYQRLEQERITTEQGQARRIAELEQRRIADTKRLEDELRAQRDADDKQRQDVNQLLSAESQKKQYVVDDRQLPNGNAPSSVDSSDRFSEDLRPVITQAQRRDMEERKQRDEEEARMLRAKAEVDRQKRYLEQLEREDQYVRARREAASRPSR